MTIEQIDKKISEIEKKQDRVIAMTNTCDYDQTGKACDVLNDLAFKIEDLQKLKILMQSNNLKIITVKDK